MKDIIHGWYWCYYNFLSWWYLLKSPYNDFMTWEFFSLMNNEVKDPFVIKLTYDDYQAFLEKLDQEPVFIDSIQKLTKRANIWDEK